MVFNICQPVHQLFDTFRDKMIEQKLNGRRRVIVTTPSQIEAPLAITTAHDTDEELAKGDKSPIDDLLSSWDFPEQSIVKAAEIGRGHFGTVFKGKLCGDQAVALKSPNLLRMTAEDFLKEADIARHCKHPNVLETIGICSELNFIITEYMANGNLKKYFANAHHELSTAECLQVALKIACGMEYLVSEKIVHRDLAARNILVGQTIQDIKVSDFGLARNLCASDSYYYITHKDVFPLQWTAPEASAFVVFEGICPVKEGRITHAVDIWSYGVVLWELYTNGKPPYQEIARNQLYKELTENNRRLEKPDKCPEAMYSKMLKCWSLEKTERPGFTHLVQFLAEQIVEEPDSAAGISDDKTAIDSPHFAYSLTLSDGRDSMGNEKSHGRIINRIASSDRELLESKNHSLVGELCRECSLFDNDDLTCDLHIIDYDQYKPYYGADDATKVTSSVGTPEDNGHDEISIASECTDIIGNQPLARPTYLLGL